MGHKLNNHVFVVYDSEGEGDSYVFDSVKAAGAHVARTFNNVDDHLLNEFKLVVARVDLSQTRVEAMDRNDAFNFPNEYGIVEVDNDDEWTKTLLTLWSRYWREVFEEQEFVEALMVEQGRG